MPRAERPQKRRSISLKTQRDVALSQLADLMKQIGMVQQEDEVQWDLDHDPALGLRQYDAQTGETSPRHDDPKFLVWRPKDQHKQKTTGRRGESKLSKRGGDISEIAKLERLEQETAEFRRRMLARDDPAHEVGEGVVAPFGPKKTKKAWPKRPFAKRRKLNTDRGLNDDAA